MMDCREVFSKVVGKVEVAWFPGDDELILGYSVSDPVISHVNSPGSLLLDGVIGYAKSR